MRSIFSIISIAIIALQMVPYYVHAYDISDGCSSLGTIERRLCEKEQAYLNRLTAFSRQHQFTALDHIIRYKKSLDVFEQDLSAYCDTLLAQTEQPRCRELSTTALARMEVVVLGTAMEFTEHQRTYYLTKQIEVLTESMERLTRLFQDIETYIVIIGEKLDYIDPRPR